MPKTHLYGRDHHVQIAFTICASGKTLRKVRAYGANFGNETQPPMEYRAHAGSQTWHFCHKCSQWPKEFNLIVQYEDPL